MRPRQRVNPMQALANLTAEEHALLRESAINDDDAWSPPKEHPTHALVRNFKGEVKDYYVWRQDHLCCYCSFPLQRNAKTYDAEHIIDKSKYPEFTFHPGNFGVSCVVCNSHKLKKSVLTEAAAREVGNLPSRRDDYTIVHPHLDEWSDYLTFDVDGRVQPIHAAGKGPNTIKTCGIHATNLLRLSSKFSGDVRQDAYNLMCSILKLKRRSKILQLIELLEKLADVSPEAQAVVRGVRELKDLA